MCSLNSLAFAAVVLATVARLSAANSSSCGPQEPSKVSDCEHTDLGSCGNACCMLDVTIPSDSEAVYHGLVEFLKGGDKSFSYVTGPDKAGHNPGDDLRQYNISWDFIFQGTHTTTGGYVDKLDFNVKPMSKTSCMLRAFSSSGIHGALGDNGQNFKTLAFMIKIVYPQTESTIVHGCGKK